MKIAITGASGFIGQELSCALSDRTDVEIIALSRNPKAGAAEPDRDGSGPEVPGSGHIIYRCTDYSVESLCEVLQDASAVVHLAAVRGTAGRISDYSVNETITENVLIAAGECGVKRVIFASSIAVYSDLASIPWTEEMCLTPKTLYGITKAACEYLCLYYGKKYDFDCAIVRIAQVLGTGEKRRVMTNVFMEQAAAGKQLRVMGRSLARRQYIYSRDLAAILARLAMEDHGTVIVNAGMKEACSNIDIARLTNQAFGSRIPVDYDDSFPETIEPSCMNTDRLDQLLGYRLLDMEEALTDIAGRWKSQDE